MPPTPRTAKVPKQASSRPLTPLLLLSFVLPLLALAFPYLSSTPILKNEYQLHHLTSDQHIIGEPKALILTAHPDDEVMFFSPTILSLVQDGWDVRGLCLSTGNSSGSGDIRSEELYGSYEALGVNRDEVKVLNDPGLQDSMTAQWDTRLIADIVEDYIKENPIDLIITFDEIGITQHPNHIAISKSLSLLDKPPKIVHLKSPATLPKFTGPFYPIYLQMQFVFSHLINYEDNRKTPNENGDQKLSKFVMISSPVQWYQSIQAMMYHQSQLVWFRWLYLIASRLMWVNELIVVEE
ncbi:uncharacterized protein L201_003081 [Kwoniella dendrophila CBS 6074]|uniref:N-acetylglucosaminylphosphatidylinositol deacetylase n=1 Tax=Kwoniella dendrophila CBS 6074 TaxID=1295534 RepID=A0AAX4JSP0_9TREE